MRSQSTPFLIQVVVLQEIPDQGETTLPLSQPALLHAAETPNHSRNIQRDQTICNYWAIKKPQLYASIRIDKLYIKSDRPGIDCEDVMGLEVEYEDHKNKLDYLIEQPVYSTD
jgi:hypothetical protein